MRAQLLPRVLPLLLLCCAVLSPNRPAMAADPGDLGIYGDAAGTLEAIEVPGFVPFDVYVVAFDPPGGLRGFEFGLYLPPGFLVLGYELIENPIILPPPGDGDWIVGLSNCYEQPLLPLLRLNLGYFQGPVVPPDALICLRATNPSTLPGVPSYLDCEDAVRPFGVAQDGGGIYPDACLVINPTDPCPGGFEYDVVLAEGRGPAGTQVVVPISVTERLVAGVQGKCTIVPGSYSGVRLELEWDPAVAGWVAASLGSGLEGWTLGAETLSEGHVRLTASNPSPDPIGLGFPSGADVFLAVFELIEGSSPLATGNEALVRASDGSDRELNGAVSLLTTLPIAIERDSFGVVKARFGSQ